MFLFPRTAIIFTVHIKLEFISHMRSLLHAKMAVLLGSWRAVLNKYYFGAKFLIPRHNQLPQVAA